MNVLVTGASGFVGSHLVERLVRETHSVRCLVRPASSLEWLRGLPVELIYDDLAQPRNLENAVTGADVIFHAAGVTKAPSADAYLEGNFRATGNLLDACERWGPVHQKFVYVSSLSAAGPSSDGRPLSEGDYPSPVSWYGRSKLLAEEAVGKWGHQGTAIIIRPPIVYGPRDRDFFHYFKSVGMGLFAMNGRGLQRISLVHVDDLIEGILLAARADRAKGQTYFICGDGEHDWLTVGEILGRVCRSRPFMVPVPLPAFRVVGALGTLLSKATGKACLLNLDKVREAAQANWLCSNRKAREEIGFKPAVALEEGLASTMDWYRQAGWL